MVAAADAVRKKSRRETRRAAGRCRRTRYPRLTDDLTQPGRKRQRVVLAIRAGTERDRQTGIVVTAAHGLPTATVDPSSPKAAGGWFRSKLNYNRWHARHHRYRLNLSSPESNAPRRLPLGAPLPGVVPAQHAMEGAGFEVWRPFPGGLEHARRRPVPPARPARARSTTRRTRPRARRGTRTAASRPSPTCSTARSSHHDSNGGGGVIGEGDTQWMTAGGGILHDEVPTERRFARRRPVRTACSCG